jgi:hypothetical protein
VVAITPRVGEAPLYDTRLLDLLRNQGERTLVCIDAPLTLPPCLRCNVPVCPGQDACVDPAVIEMRRIVRSVVLDAADRDGRRGKPSITPYTQRPTEVHLLYQRGIAPREALGQGTGPLAARAAHLVRALADRFRLNENLVEVYPKGTLAALGFARPYKKHLYERRTRAEILEAIAPDLTFGPGVWRELCVQNDHLFEAVICAFTGVLWARDDWAPPADAATPNARDGWIWIPPPAPNAAARTDEDTGIRFAQRAATATRS